MFSLDEVLEVCKPLLDRESSLDHLAYPERTVYVKSYIHALTSGDNSYSLDVDKFIESMKKFGVLSPFPYYVQKPKAGESPRHVQNTPYRIQILEDASPKRSNLKGQNSIPIPDHGPSPLRNSKKQEIAFNNANQPSGQDFTTEEKGLDNFLRLDSTSSLFAQHYSLLRELKSYTSEFRMLIKNEAEISEVWKCFESLSTVLENGCQFLSFPMQI